MSDVSVGTGFENLEKPEVQPWHRRFVNNLLSTGRAFLPVYALAILTFVLGFAVSSVTKNQPDLATSASFGTVLAYLFIFVFCAILVVKFFYMALVEKPKSPSLALLKWLYDIVSRENRAFNVVHMFASVCIFIAGFSVLKGAIAILHPFSWDTTFLAWDKALHFGKLPHIWLKPLIDSALAVQVFNFFYNLWFFILISSLMMAGAGMARSSYHRSYMISFMLTWLVAGFFIATIFSSAGPCFYFRAGFGTEYQDLMTALQVANETNGIWALETQDVLWQGFTGERAGSAGISAFPSLHVASSVLLALYASSINRILGVLAWLFAAIIMVGSVVLAWHYAVDGYAGGLIALLIWKVTRHFERQHEQTL